MTTIYHNLLEPTSVSVTSNELDYPVNNIINRRIGKQWRSTDTTQQEVVMSLGSQKSIKSILVQSCNFSSCDVAVSDDNNTYTDLGTLNTEEETNTRRKGVFTTDQTKQYIKLTIPNSATTDGASYFFIGSVYIFGSFTDVKIPFGINITHVQPQTSLDLVNGRISTINTGHKYAEIDFEILKKDSDDLNQTLNLARSNLICLDLTSTDNLERVWPCELVTDSVSSSMNDLYFTNINLTLREVV